MPYDDASDPVFERFFGRHLEFSPNKEMAKRFMLSYSTYTRLNVQEQWTKWKFAKDYVANSTEGC